MIHRIQLSAISKERAQQVEQYIQQQLTQYFPDYSFEVAMTEDMYGQASITIHTEVSIDMYEKEKSIILRKALLETAPLFESLSWLQCLVVRVGIYDDKVSVSDQYILREDIIEWKNKPTQHKETIPAFHSYGE